MGLDMYLSASRTIYQQWQRNEQTGESERSLDPVAVAVRAAIGVEFTSGNLDYTKVEIEAAYWRKANAVHRWFVARCQDGKDDCNAYDVGREDLAELRDLCQQVSADHTLAPKLLPTQDGFFFGHTDYDEWYFDDIESTIWQIDKALKLPEEWDFTYRASW